MEARKYDPKNVQLEEVDLHQEAESWKRKQQDDLIIDFDQAVAEEKAKAIKVRFEGKVYELPKSTPAWLPLFINKHADKDGVVSDEKNLEMIAALLGRDFAEKVADDKNNFVSFELVNSKILKPVMEEWGFDQFQDESDKKK